MSEKIDRRHHRKRSSRSKHGKPFNRMLSKVFKKAHAKKSPEEKAKIAEHCRAMSAKKALDPRKNSRFGIFDGHNREQSEQIWAQAREKATKVIQKMQEKGVIAQDDDPRAIRAIQAAIEVMETPTNQQLKLAASRLILDFTKSKPVAKHEHTINAAEQWLAAVSDEDEQATADEGEAP